MKNKISLVLILMAAVVFCLSSCTKKSEYLNSIPKGAFVVVSIDGKACQQMAKPEMLLENEQYKEGIKEIEQTSKKIAEFVGKAVKDPNETGILFDGMVYGFAEMEKENLVIGIIAGVDKDKFEENIKMITAELKVEFKTQEKDGISYFMPEETMIMGWDKNRILILTLAEGSDFDLEKKFFALMNQKKDESILTDKDFNAFLKDSKDFNIWISSNVIDHLPNTEDVTEAEKMIGFDFNDNYAHIHFDAEKAEWTLTAKFRYNESIQKADWNKIIKNITDSGMLDEFFGSMFGGGYDEDEYEDYDWESDTAFQELTDEEWAEIEKMTKNK